MPRVTIIMPTYERPETVRTAIRSALDQRDESFVLCIGDDSVSDDVQLVVEEFDDPRIDYRRNVVRLGASGNWIALLRSAGTPYVASLNDDDEWMPDFLERLVPPLDHDEDVAVSFGDFWLVDDEGRVLDDATETLSKQTRRASLAAGPCGLGRADGLRLVAVWNAPQPAICAVMRTGAVRGITFPPEVRSIHDIWLSYQVVMQDGVFHYTPERLSRYRRHAASLTRTVGFAGEEDYVFGRIVVENSGEWEAVREVKQYWASIRWGRSGALIDAADRAGSQRELMAAFPDLRGARRLVALAAAKSRVAWGVLAGARALRGRMRSSLSSGGRPHRRVA